MKQKNGERRVSGNSILLLLLFCCVATLCSQHKFRFNNDDISSLTFGRDRNNGFRASVSLVAMFTAGAADRNGFRLGMGVTLSQTMGDWTFSVGTDAYKAKQQFGAGTSFAGFLYNTGSHGFSYHVNKYYQGDRQVSAIMGLRIDDFELNFEDDILAVPFTGFKIQDRFRSAGLELRYKGFILGTNVYTADINGVTDVSPGNSRGVYRGAKQISSPLYVGYTTNGAILRYGLNSKLGGLIGQNGWHRLFFNTPDFEYGGYKNQFLQVGADKRYTLY